MKDFTLFGILDVNDLIKLAVILVITYGLQFFSKQIITRIIKHSVREAQFATKKDEIQREDTLISIIYTTARSGIWILGGLLALGVFNINIGPLLAGAGIAGVALGFGAQTIVKDFLAGLFILAENQYRVGDVVQINQTISGTVERVTLRMTVLRNIEGSTHYIPNGTIDTATNMTMDYASVDLKLRVSYNSDIDMVEKIINKIGEKLYTEDDWKDRLLEAPYMLRIDSFEDSAIIVRVVCRTAPIQQWSTKGELLRRIKKAFEKEGIEVPFPQVVVHQPASKK